MKNTFGTSLSVTLFGESHGEAIGAVLDGIAPGIEYNSEYIQKKMKKRAPQGNISTSRKEADSVEILSGVYNGKTTGTPICFVIKNSNTKSADYSELADTPRPGHADLTAEYKYHGYADPRGGGHFSGRISAALVAAGSLVQYALEKKGIYIVTHIKKCGSVEDRDFEILDTDRAIIEEGTFPMLNAEAAKKAKEEILLAKSEGDSVGGILETAVYGIPAGVGEPWFDSFEGVLSHMLFSVPAVKGVEFGCGFSFADMKGSEANDNFRTDGAKIETVTNNNGGINGGITNGMPVIFRCAIKPTPSIFKEQQTVNLKTMTDTSLTIKGRHDPCIVHRAAAVIDAATAIAIGDLLVQRYGTDRLGGE